MSLLKIWQSLSVETKQQVTFEESADLTSYTTLQLISYAPLFTVRTISALQELIVVLNSRQVEFFVLGKGANSVCITQQQFPLIYLDFFWDKQLLAEYKSSYILPASIPLSILTGVAIKLGLLEWEVFSGIPATLGGATFMNAGTRQGEIGDLVKRVWIVTSQGKIREEKIIKDSFSYRHNNFLKRGEIIIQVELVAGKQNRGATKKIKDYLQIRNKQQPLDHATCGCTFKNYIGVPACSAGKFIDIMGLKGLSYRGLKISHRHANFIEHHGGATDQDFLYFTRWIRQLLWQNYGIRFDFEYQCLGKLND